MTTLDSFDFTNSLAKQPRVLIIDDDPDISSVLVAALEVVGCAVTAENSSDLAEEACRASKPDLVLVDMMMPGRSGLDLIAPLHEISPDAIICIMTGMGDPALLQRSLKSGAWNVLCKPYSLTDLAELIDLSLRLSASLREERGVSQVAQDIQIEFRGDHKPDAVDIARLIAVAAGNNVDGDIAYRKLPLLASELLDNAFEHGTRSDPEKRFGVNLAIANDCVDMRVWDNGTGFNGSATLRQLRHSAPHGKLSGLQLAAALADQMEFVNNPNSVIVRWSATPKTLEGSAG